MEESDMIISSTEIIKDRFYFATLQEGYKPKQTKNSRFFHIEDEIIYESFYDDFGPYHLCHLFQFCMKIEYELGKHSKKKIVFYTSSDDKLRLNAAYLIGSYQIIYQSKTPEEVYDQLTCNSDWNLLTFRDASGGPAIFDISLLDVLRGLKVAHQWGFFDFSDFDDDQYLFYERVENADLNWIVPGKMLAFSGPHSKSWIDHGYPIHSPEHYRHYFKIHNVTAIVRLNKKSYDARQFTVFGFEHKDLFFVDGSVPSDAIVNRFLRISEQTKGAVAVHCKAGLGRTGTLIACYMMKHWGFRAREAIAWLRICRPGSVIGHQQWFLEKIEQRMLRDGEAYRRARNQSMQKYKRGIYSTHLPEPLKLDNTNVHLRDWSSTKKKVDNENALNSNTKCDSENNLTSVISKVKTAPTPMLAKTVFTQKKNTPPVGKNGNNAKPQPKAVSQTLKSFSAKTSTFPPTRASAISLSKIGVNNVKGQTKPTASNKPTILNTYTRKMPTRSTEDSKVTLVTATLSTLTENCHLNGRKRHEANLINTRKKSLTRSTSITRTKMSKSSKNDDISSSDATNLSADSLDCQNRRVEAMDCLSNSIITADVTPDNFDETVNSQGNRLYKIKALRKRSFSLKKEGLRTRSSSLNAVRKK